MICTLKSCGKEFTPTDKRHKYCSSSCRAKDSMLRKALGATPTEKKPPSLFDDKPIAKMEINKPAGLDLQVQYVFDAQNKEIKRWEDLHKEERDKRKKLQEEKAALEKELTDLRTDLRIKDVSKPTGLEGVMENPVIRELIPHFAPVLAGWLGQKMNGQPMQVEGVTDSAAQWASTQSEAVQKALREVMEEIGKITDENKLLSLLIQFKNLVNNKAPFSGTTTMPRQMII